MNINASIIDQQVIGICDKIKVQAEEELGIKNDINKLKSLSFVYMCVKEVLGLSEHDEIFDCLTEGGGDIAIDALHYRFDNDDDFEITIFQGKYHKDLNNTKEFGENDIDKITKATSVVLDPNKALDGLNKRLSSKVEVIHSIIKDGNLPNIKVVACSNGRKWNALAQKTIDNYDPEGQIVWEYINYDSLIKLMQAQKTIDCNLKTVKKSIVDDVAFGRMCVGQITLGEIVELVKQNGDRLFDKNIRRYLGLHNNRVNLSIHQTITSEYADYFFLLNNGITMICNKFDHNDKQKEDKILKVQNLQIINGGQTCMTIFKTFSEGQSSIFDESNLNATVLFRLYQLPSDSPELINRITYATNSQNPVNLSDLKSNDETQWKLAESIRGLGYNYKIKREKSILTSFDISPKVVAEAVLSVWCKIPQKSKFSQKEHFDKLYNTIFDGLNGAQAIIAVMIYRIAENNRKRPKEGYPEFLLYASTFVAMQIGKYLCADLGFKGYKNIQHTNFENALEILKSNSDEYLKRAFDDITAALEEYYNKPLKDISHPFLASIFRRGDLLDYLK